MAGGSQDTPLPPHRLGGRWNSTTFKSWQVFVFDGSTTAISYAAVQRAASKPRYCSGVVRRANNVVYFGAHLRSAAQAISELQVDIFVEVGKDAGSCVRWDAAR